MSALPWYEALFVASESDLCARNVPPCYWVYIVCNDRELPSDGLGTFFEKRADAEKCAAGCRNDMGAVVIDGRDIVLLKKWLILSNVEETVWRAQIARTERAHKRRK